jgi:hypothetical protein
MPSIAIQKITTSESDAEEGNRKEANGKAGLSDADAELAASAARLGQKLSEKRRTH